MSLETIIVQFGYPGLVTGLFLEGETALVLGAFMAHRGYLDLPLVILIGFIVAFGSDQFFFWMGRTHGTAFLEKRPSWASKMEKARALLGKNSTLLFLGIRFVYGLRTVLPFAIGMSKADARKFVILNLIGAVIWAVLFGMAGYLSGRAIEMIFGDIGRYEHWIVLGLVLSVGGVWFFHWRSSKARKQDEK